MRTPRLGRPPFAADRPALIPLIAVSAAAWLASPALASAADREVSGTVVDQSGQPLPRAYVRLLDPTRAQDAATFADEAGRFRLTAGADCRVEVSLTGFQTADVACATAPLRVVLAVAPVHETVVVSATRTEAPTDQVGASVTAFAAADLERKQIPLVGL